MEKKKLQWSLSSVTFSLEDKHARVPRSSFQQRRRQQQQQSRRLVQPRRLSTKRCPSYAHIEYTNLVTCRSMKRFKNYNRGIISRCLYHVITDYCFKSLILSLFHCYIAAPYSLLTFIFNRVSIMRSVVVLKTSSGSITALLFPALFTDYNFKKSSSCFWLYANVVVVPFWRWFNHRLSVVLLYMKCHLWAIKTGLDFPGRPTLLSRLRHYN